MGSSIAVHRLLLSPTMGPTRSRMGGMVTHWSLPLLATLLTASLDASAIAQPTGESQAPGVLALPAPPRKGFGADVPLEGAGGVDVSEARDIGFDTQLYQPESDGFSSEWRKTCFSLCHLVGAIGTYRLRAFGDEATVLRFDSFRLGGGRKGRPRVLSPAGRGRRLLGWVFMPLGLALQGVDVAAGAEEFASATPSDDIVVRATVGSTMLGIGVPFGLLGYWALLSGGAGPSVVDQAVPLGGGVELGPSGLLF